MWKSTHNWKRIYSLLLVLLLMSGSLVACEQTNSKGDNPPDTPSIQDGEQEDLRKTFNDVEKTRQEFQTSLDNFITDVAAVRDGLKERGLVNSSEVNEKLIELQEKVSQYKSKIFQTRDEENLQQIFNGINLNIQDIRQITEELKNGLGQDENKDESGKNPIGQVQLYLEIAPNREVSYYGQLGPITIEKINESLTQKSEQLETNIIDLGERGGFIKPSVPPTNVNDLTARITNLEARNKKLVAQINNNEAEINNLKNLNNELQNIPSELNQLKISQLILGIFLAIIFLVLAVITLKLVVEELKSPRRKNATRKRNDTVGSTGNSNTQEFIYEVNDKVEDFYEELEKRSKTSASEREKLQNQIIKLQKNQQVKTPDNNANNRKLIFELENKVDEISRQLQEISKWWSNQKNQINQLQQNRQVMTSSNVAGSYETPRTINYSPSPVTPEPQMNRQTSTNQYSGSSGLQLISTYQQNPRLLLKNAIEVSEADESIDQRRMGGGQGVILQKARRGNYWILNEGGTDYMVPKDNIKINEYNLETVRNLFECQGYRSGYSGFQLIKAAIVSSVSRGEVWQLVEPGVLKFY